MKTFKLSKRVQIILATLLVLVAGIIAVVVCSNDEVMAGTPCSKCGNEREYAIDEIYHGYYCFSCEEWLNQEKHNTKNKEPIEGKYVDNGNQTHFATYKCDVCSQEYVDEEEEIPCTLSIITTDQVSAFTKFHKYICEFCFGDSQEIPHEIIYTYENENEHKTSCSAPGCPFSAMDSHNGLGCEKCQKVEGDCPVDRGILGKCDGKLIWRNLGEKGHVRICTRSGCTANLTYDEPTEHVYVNGVCLCGATNSDIKVEGNNNGCGTCTESKVKYIDAMYHQISCTCGSSIKKEQHSYNNGKCVCGHEGSNDEGEENGECETHQYKTQTSPIPGSEGKYHDVRSVCSVCGDVAWEDDSPCKDWVGADGLCTVCGVPAEDVPDGPSGGGGGRRRRRRKLRRRKQRRRR